MKKKKINNIRDHRKIFILDTSVLVYDSKAVYSFEGNDVILSITVLDELDKLKKLQNEVGKNARVCIRTLDVISQNGDIHKGISLDKDINFKIDTSAYGSLGTDPLYGDTRILACAAKTKQKNPTRKVILVSKDINLRVRAKAFGLIAEDYEKDKIQSEELYTGFREINDESLGLLLKEEGVLDCAKFNLNDSHQNECFAFINNRGSGVALGRRVDDNIKLITDKRPWGLSLRGKEQLFAIDLLLDPNVPLVSIVGTAGTGKTLISIAAGLDLVLEKRRYDSFLLYRPLVSMGNHDVGFLPGDLESKLSPHFTAIDDAFAYLFSDKSRKKDGWKQQLYQYIDNGTIQKEALTYIRGRSIPSSLMLIDEAQNLSKEEIKTILTRAGNDTKIILNGDIHQIDSPYLDPTNNGLSYVVEKFKNSKLAGHITLTKGERSPLATEAAKIL